MSKRKPRGYWKSKKNTLVEAKRIMKKERWIKLPPFEKLISEGYSSLATSIYTYHGGMVKFRMDLGEDPQYGRWRELNYAKREAKKIMNEEDWDTLPSESVLTEKGYSNLANGICRYHGGIRNFRAILGQNQIQIKKGKWKNLEFALTEAQKCMETEGKERLPNGDYLRKKGYGKLTRAIYAYHGGFPSFRQVLEERMNGRSEVEQLSSLLEKYASGGENE